MPDFLLLIFIPLITVVIFIYAIENRNKQVFLLLILPCTLLFWLVGSKLENTKPYEYGVFETKEVNGASVIVIDGHPKNMTATFSQNLKDGTKIRVFTYKQWAGGIYHEMSDEYQFEIVKAEE